jgi:hypothetical protein
MGFPKRAGAWGGLAVAQVAPQTNSLRSSVRFACLNHFG